MKWVGAVVAIIALGLAGIPESFLALIAIALCVLIIYEDHRRAEHRSS